MEKQNITISVPKDIFIKIKHIAVERETSVSALIVTLMQDIAFSKDEYQAARRRHKKIMEKGFNLGTHGKITWDRDSLHER